jgi:hypothetical protein
MSLTGVKQEVAMTLPQVEERLLEMQRKLAEGAPREKVEAAGELEFLRQQKTGLERRLAELDHLPEGRWETIRQWLKEEAEMLELRSENWIARM